MAKVAVIVPAYNAEEYLQDAIDSVFSQSLCDWELILIDDGSTDRTRFICDLAARRSERVKVIRQPNRGVSAARNAGLERIDAKYVAFLDADDTLPPTALSFLVEVAENTGADIVCGSIHASGNTSAVSSFSPCEAVESMLYQKEIDNSPWGKLYDANLWTSTRFPEGIRYEDLALLPLLFLKAHRILKTKACVYNYRNNPDSYLHTFSLRRADVLRVTARLVEEMAAVSPTLHKAAKARQLNANFNIFGLLAANFPTLPKEGKDGKSAISAHDYTKAMLLVDECWNKIKELRGEVLRNPKVRMKTKAGILLSYLGRPLSRSILKYFYL